MQISTKSRYGLRSMIYLAQKKKICSAKEIAREERIPLRYLEKIMSKLKKAGLVRVKRGAGGGYFLAFLPNKIKVGQIIKTLEGTMALVFCLDKRPKNNIFCPKQKGCVSKIVWQKIQRAIISTLNSLTLADLIKK